jgi:Lon protease-like protein
MSVRELPLFPLQTVLFPGMVLPLHIFEARYRTMIDLCLRENKPFGVLLIRDGHEVGGPAITYRMGTSAYITQAETLPDGRINILSVGYQRFSL